MGGFRGIPILRACVVAGSLALAFVAAAQDVRIGMDRAVSTPLEILWLRAEILEQWWREHPALARDRGAIGERPWRRYELGGNPATGGFAPLGRRLHVVSPKAGGAALVRAPDGALLLAAGAVVQLVDAAYPEIRIEIRAPRDRPLPLGNLVPAGIHKAAALLAQRTDLSSATVASVGSSARVALRSGEPSSRPAPTMLASIAPAVSLPDIDRRTHVPFSSNGEGTGREITLYARAEPAPVKVVVASIAPLPDLDQRTRVAVAANGEGSGRDTILYAEPEIKIVAAALGDIDQRTRALLRANGEGTGDDVVLHAPLAEKILVASVFLPDLDQRTHAAVRSNGEGSGTEVVLYAPPAPAVAHTALPDIDQRTRVAVRANGEGTGDGVVIYATARTPERPVMSSNPSVARLRAEVEDEIRRDNERLLARMQACVRSGADAREGCVIAAPPRRFASAGA